MPEEFIAVLVVGLMTLIPITAMLLNHQRKMAEIIHRKAEPTPELLEVLRHMQAQIDYQQAALEDIKRKSLKEE